MKTQNLPYQPRIDFLRFFAAAAVVFLHAYGGMQIGAEARQSHPVLDILVGTVM